ncbi:glycosyltransferase [Bacteroides fragilis]|uniref:glycosyltransferase n=1 Tax=Bacteroides fragilis TaxID=817 RepID=UPI0022AABC0C|nr:glycosyltransferase [Bacteroides fragilis]MCZ2695830.1 glycosyltransferase [Bacteroides fragilis]
MKKALGIFRGFPGLGRVVAGVSIMETLRDRYGYDIRMISYLQGNKYLALRGYDGLKEATTFDYCSIGLLPTNKMGVHIHNTIKSFMPDVCIVDGEPLILQSIKISYPNIKIVALLNPSDVDNPSNDKEAMDFFNAIYSLCDLAVVHGLRILKDDGRYKSFISIPTILRREIFEIKNIPTNNIYCVLGGGTENVDMTFVESTIRIAELCQEVATLLPQYTIHLICSSQNIFNALTTNNMPKNLRLYDKIISPNHYYSDASLIITRSGRNTLSELAFLGIPAISFISGCSYRTSEQSSNVKDLDMSCVKAASLEITPLKLSELCTKMIGLKSQNCFQCGNHIAINNILTLCD